MLMFCVVVVCGVQRQDSRNLHNLKRLVSQVDNYPNQCCKRFETLKEAQQAFYMSKVEEIPLQPLSSKTGASKIAEGKGGGLIACVGIKDIIIIVLVGIIVYLCLL